METDKQKQILRTWLEREQEVDYGTLVEELSKVENEELKSILTQLNALDHLSANRKKMWRQIQLQVKPVHRHLFPRYLKYTAVCILVFCGAWMLKLMFEERTEQEKEITEIAALKPGKQKAYLLIDGKERVELSTFQADTTIHREGFQVKVDSKGYISYASSTLGLLEKENTLVTPRAGEYKVVLSDGSVVWLNSESRLTYPTVFSGTKRVVHLSGEGCFNIVQDEKRPFQVIVDQELTINVLGTLFNVNAYRDSEEVVTTLVSGKVELKDRDGHLLSVLHPEQQAIFKNGKIAVQNVSSEMYVGWLNGKFYFESMPLLSIMQQLQRWYDIDFTFTSEDLKALEFTGVIRRDYTAEEIFKIIEKTIWVKFEIEERKVIISFKEKI